MSIFKNQLNSLSLFLWVQQFLTPKLINAGLRVQQCSKKTFFFPRGYEKGKTVLIKKKVKSIDYMQDIDLTLRETKDAEEKEKYYNENQRILFIDQNPTRFFVFVNIAEECNKI